MPRHFCSALLLLAGLSAAGCTTPTVEERARACQAIEWSTYGRNDGLLGVASSERDEKFADCAALGYPADLHAYQAGRADGLKSYCTVENGYDAGYADRRYRDVCPPELESSFLQGYEQGQNDRPVTVYPYFGFGFGYYDLWGNEPYRRHPRRSRNVK